MNPACDALCITTLEPFLGEKLDSCFTFCVYSVINCDASWYFTAGASETVVLNMSTLAWSVVTSVQGRVAIASEVVKETAPFFFPYKSPTHHS